MAQEISQQAPLILIVDDADAVRMLMNYSLPEANPPCPDSTSGVPWRRLLPADADTLAQIDQVLQRRQLQHQAELEQEVARRTAELEQSRMELNSIFESLPAMVCIKELDGRYCRINRRFEEETGLDRDQVIGRDDRQLFDAERAEALMRLDRQALNDQRPISREEVLPGPNGLPHSLLSTRVPLLDGRQRPYALLGISIDISPLKQLQQQLSRAESLAHLGSWGYDIGSGEMSCSEETYRIFGLEPGSKPRIEDIWARFQGQDADHMRQAWAEVLHQGRTLDLEKVIEYRGEQRWLHCQAEVLYDDAGQAVQVEGSVQDITGVKDFHEALLAALAESERLARIRSEFLANMSHEIRTPLNGILGLAQIGQREAGEAKSRQLFDQLLQSGNLLLGIVNDILDFSKIEAGKLQVNPAPMQLEQVIDHLNLICAERAADKGLGLSIERQPRQLPWIIGDALRISQVLVNLVGNAIKFTETGAVALRIRVDQGQLEFEVRDTGIGMSPEQLESLFRPFEQADGSITRRFGGTGLGLSISKSLVELMQGQIEVESQLGVGSCFRLRLPVQLTEAPAAQAHGRDQASAGQRLAGLNILAAEDNAVNRMVLEDMLRLEGARVFCVEDGQQALDLVRHDGGQGWDILLSDVHMPVMGGCELAQSLSQECPRLPVVGVTALAMEDERQHCLKAGMVDQVTKPLVLDDLVDTVLRHARRQPSQSAVPATGASPAPAQGPTQAADQSPPDCSWPQREFIDEQQLLERYNGRRAFIDKLFDSLLSSHGNSPERLRQALARSDWEQLAFTAHSLAGVLGALCAHRLRAQAKALEEQARAGVSATEQAIEQATEQIASDVEQMLNRITHYRANAPQPRD
ncbi:PAS domain-containing protein [Magnetovirga frankeli]|uniref:ATP-binding protein n=1 Tax=Magnetovirga frankeli TaxID=947516 RepID=UPI001293F48F|nr:PAS domain-containing protein [gamma proteobacterium SS-5]